MGKSCINGRCFSAMFDYLMVIPPKKHFPNAYPSYSLEKPSIFQGIHIPTSHPPGGFLCRTDLGIVTPTFLHKLMTHIILLLKNLPRYPIYYIPILHVWLNPHFRRSIFIACLSVDIYQSSPVCLYIYIHIWNIYIYIINIINIH